MRSKSAWLPIVLSLVLVLFLALLIKAAGHTRPVRAATEFTVCPSGVCDFVSIQDAVDAAEDGDTIKVAAFTYHAVTARRRDDIKTTGLVTQVVYITKSITLRGGYATGFPEPPDPVANPTVLDPNGQGRGLYIAGDVSPTIEGFIITDGDAVGLGGWSTNYDWNVGGGIYVYSTTATIRNCQIMTNTVSTPDSMYGNGGGVYMGYSSGALIDNTISGNTTAEWNSEGGGVFLTNSPATLTGNTITDNHSGFNGDGGGVSLSNSAATLTGNTISGNSVSRSGGGLKLYLGDVSLTGNTISGNTANVSGGGLTASWSDGLDLSGNTFYSNTAGTKGGGVNLSDSDTLFDGNTFDTNTADGTAYNHGGGGVFVDDSTVTLEDNVFVDNTTSANGGGMYVYASTSADMDRNLFRGNNASLSGGGLYLFGDSATLGYNRFLDNQAANGGGLYLDSADVDLINNVIANNQLQPGGSGGGAVLRRCSSSMLFNTVARNTGGDGSGVQVTDFSGQYSDVELANTIMFSQTVGIKVGPGNVTELDATLWAKVDLGISGMGVTHTNDYVGDPSFVNVQLGDYHIQEDSAARDKGVDVFVYTDMDGQLRPEGNGHDIGADEFWLLYRVFLPLTLRDG